METELSSDSPRPVARARVAELTKQGLFALMTGGLSLLWLVAKALPRAWERTWLLRADWVAHGREPREWAWLGQGWLAVLGTALVALPASLILGSLGSFVFRFGTLTPGQRLPLPALAFTLIFLCTFLTVFGLVTIYCAHTLRMAVSLAWTWIRSFIPRSHP